tara:strand:+ start:195445 stop:195633 length:189 start_codon:yes stop_codon:yes gene_type:complete
MKEKKESIMLGVANEGEQSFDLALVKEWEINKTTKVGDTIFFEVDGTYFSVSRDKFDNIITK